MSLQHLVRTILVAALLIPLAQAQTTIHVPADQPTIQAGINAAQNGDTVLVAPGTYNELIDFKGKAITVTSGATGYAQASATIINGGNTDGPVATFQTNESAAAILNGFTLQNGKSAIAPTIPGGGIYIDAASPTITNNIIQNNIGCGILIAAGASPTIQTNLITDNTGPGSEVPPACESPVGFGKNGSGVALWNAGDVSLIGNTISDNFAEPDTSESATDCSNNISIYGGHLVTLIDNTLEYSARQAAYCYGNLVEYYAGGYPQYPASPQKLLLIQNVFINGGIAEYGDNTQTYPTVISVQNTHYLAGVSAFYSYSVSEIANNIFDTPILDPTGVLLGNGELNCSQYNSNQAQQLDIHADLIFNLGTIYPTGCILGPGIIYADPQLIDPANGNFRLQPTSPAIDAGDINAPDLPPADFAGKNRTVCGTVDLGAYNHHPAPPIALTASPNPSVGGSPVTLSVQLTGNCNIPTGLITFLDGNTTLGTATLSSTASASFSTASLTVGTHTLTATYPGDFNFDPSTSSPVTQVVTGYPTATTLAAAPNPATALQTIALSSNVSSNFGTPNGTVTFYANSTPLATAPLDPNGHAQATVSTLGAGTWPLTAVYNPSILFASSTSPIVTEVIDGATTATSLASAPNPSTFGQPVTFTAAVTAAQSTAIPTGTVTFRDSSNPAGTVTLGQSTLNASGIATLSISTLSVGTHTISAVYSGSANDNPSTSPTVAQIVVSAPVSIALTADPNPANQGQLVSLAVTVSATGTPAPTGSVAFLDTFQGQTTTLATATLVNGQAAFSTSTLALGTHSLTAVFAASGNYAAGTSNTVSELIQSHDFSIILAPASIVSAAGPHLHIAVALTSLGSYTGTLTLAAAPLPQYSGAAFSPATLTLAPGQTANSTLTLATSQLPPGIARDASRVPTAVWPATLFLPLLLVRRRTIQRLTATLLAAALLSAATGCTTVSYQLNLLAPGTYTIPVTATDPSTGIAHTANLTITITQ